MLGPGGQGPVIAAPPEALGAGEHLQTHHMSRHKPHANWHQGLEATRSPGSCPPHSLSRHTPVHLMPF